MRLVVCGLGNTLTWQTVRSVRYPCEAHLDEQLTLNHQAAGSTPVTRTVTLLWRGTMPEICYHCGTMAENDTFSKDVISKDHAVCHGWFHCGPGCCGDCYVCEEDTVLGVNDFSSLEALRSAYRKQEESYV